MIRVTGLGLTVGSFTLGPISLHVDAGDYFVLLGPTGMGKTLFVECLCGLIRPAQGRIEIDGRDVTRLAPRRRGIGYVPQHQGLFPHLRVRDNIVFPLRARRLRAREIRKRIEPLVELLGLESLLERWPSSLSGGERQKAALARALATHPRLLLLDEPVSAVDELTRDRLCTELRRIHTQLQPTTIHISHNIEEAIAVADRGGVLRHGRLVQAGPMADLLRRPASDFVARFFRSENILQAAARPAPDGTSELAFAGHTLTVPGRHDGPVTFVARPEVLLVQPAASAAPNGIQAVLRRVTDRGPYRRLDLDAGIPLVAYATGDAAALQPAIGQPCTVVFPPHAIHILP